jgi:myo-inositol-1(or 4)-monophosphatase
VELHEKDLDHFLEKAVTASKKTGDTLRGMMPVDHRLNAQERLNLIDEADHKSHDSLYDSIREAFPEHEYVSAATENQTFFKEGYLWVLDPLIGLVNFSHGDPHYSISAALMVDGITVAGVVYNPVFNELFTAIKGHGSFLNGKSIRVSNTDTLKHSLLATRFPYDIRDGKTTNLGIFNHLITKTEGIFNNSTATFDLANVACGQYDGFWALHMSPWDLTAAILLIKEAGGKVTTLSGEDYFTDSKEILATNGAFHQEVVDTISEIPQKSW